MNRLIISNKTDCLGKLREIEHEVDIELIQCRHSIPALNMWKSNIQKIFEGDICSLELYLQLSIKYFVNSCFLSKLFSKL